MVDVFGNGVCLVDARGDDAEAQRQSLSARPQGEQMEVSSDPENNVSQSESGRWWPWGEDGAAVSHDSTARPLNRALLQASGGTGCVDFAARQQPMTELPHEVGVSARLSTPVRSNEVLLAEIQEMLSQVQREREQIEASLQQVFTEQAHCRERLDWQAGLREESRQAFEDALVESRAALRKEIQAGDALLNRRLSEVALARAADGVCGGAASESGSVFPPSHGEPIAPSRGELQVTLDDFTQSRVDLVRQLEYIQMQMTGERVAREEMRTTFSESLRDCVLRVEAAEKAATISVQGDARQTMGLDADSMPAAQQELVDTAFVSVRQELQATLSDELDRFSRRDFEIASALAGQRQLLHTTVGELQQELRQELQNMLSAELARLPQVGTKASVELACLPSLFEEALVEQRQLLDAAAEQQSSIVDRRFTEVDLKHACLLEMVKSNSKATDELCGVVAHLQLAQSPASTEVYTEATPCVYAGAPPVVSGGAPDVRGQDTLVRTLETTVMRRARSAEPRVSPHLSSMPQEKHPHQGPLAVDAVAMQEEYLEQQCHSEFVVELPNFRVDVTRRCDMSKSFEVIRTDLAQATLSKNAASLQTSASMSSICAEQLDTAERGRARSVRDRVMPTPSEDLRAITANVIASRPNVSTTIGPMLLPAPSVLRFNSTSQAMSSARGVGPSAQPAAQQALAVQPPMIQCSAQTSAHGREFKTLAGGSHRFPPGKIISQHMSPVPPMTRTVRNPSSPMQRPPQVQALPPPVTVVPRRLASHRASSVEVRKIGFDVPPADKSSPKAAKSKSKIAL